MIPELPKDWAIGFMKKDLENTIYEAMKRHILDGGLVTPITDLDFGKGDFSLHSTFTHVPVCRSSPKMTAFVDGLEIGWKAWLKRHSTYIFDELINQIGLGCLVVYLILLFFGK